MYRQECQMRACLPMAVKFSRLPGIDSSMPRVRLTAVASFSTPGTADKTWKKHHSERSTLLVIQHKNQATIIVNHIW